MEIEKVLIFIHSKTPLFHKIWNIIQPALTKACKYHLFPDVFKIFAVAVFSQPLRHFS